MEPRRDDITQILLAAGAGDADAADRLWALVYDELRAIAHRELRGERRGQTLSTTALVHEAYFKFVDHAQVAWRDRSHFFALACRAMRQILVDHARYLKTQKRAGRQHQLPLEAARTVAVTDPEALLALDEVLTRLAAFDARLGQVVECRFFGGLSAEETAEVLGVSTRTVVRDWSRAKAYLYRALRMDP